MYLRLLLERKIALLVQILVAPIYALIKSVEDYEIWAVDKNSITLTFSKMLFSILDSINFK